MGIVHRMDQYPVRRVAAVMALVIGGVMASLVSSLGHAAVADKTAHEVAREVKDELVTVIRNRQELVKEGGSEKYFNKVEEVLLPVVDFGYIARGVMGQYAKEASEEQRQRFKKTFQNGLITTYAKGLASYGDHEIKVVPPEEDMSDKRTVSVVMKVEGGDATNVLAFTMKLNRDKEWKLTNMVLNGVNLGRTFRNQFAQAMKKTGDLDTVIDNWNV